jgi:hypothetical protein
MPDDQGGGIGEISMRPLDVMGYLSPVLNVVGNDQRINCEMPEGIAFATVDGDVSKELLNLCTAANEGLKAYEAKAKHDARGYVGADDQSAIVIDGVIGATADGPKPLGDPAAILR